MTQTEILFSVANNGVLPFWGLLVLAPRWRGTQLLVHSAVPALLFGGLYGLLILLGRPGPEGGGFGSLTEVQKLFSSPTILAAGWVHYIVFDLFVGAWLARDAARRGIHHLWTVPCLVLTLMLGPLGLLAYLALRALLRRDWLLDEGGQPRSDSATSGST